MRGAAKRKVHRKTAQTRRTHLNNREGVEDLDNLREDVMDYG